jgi:hypothetical protein
LNRNLQQPNHFCPSPFKSRIATEAGLVPVVKSVLAEKVGVAAPGVVVFKKTDTDVAS